MKTAKPRAIFMFGFVAWTLAAFAAVDVKPPCWKGAMEGCWYCYFRTQRPTTRGMQAAEGIDGSNRHLVDAIAQANREIKLVTTDRKIFTEGEAVGYPSVP